MTPEAAATGTDSIAPTTPQNFAIRLTPSRQCADLNTNSRTQSTSSGKTNAATIGEVVRSALEPTNCASSRPGGRPTDPLPPLSGSPTQGTTTWRPTGRCPTRPT